jgi:hypothetical protein
MLIFFVFHGSYALVHLYLFFKIKGLFLHIDPLANILLALFLSIMAFSPMIIYFSSLRGGGKCARAFAFSGYLWMGFLILFFFPSIFLDLYNLIVISSEFIFKQRMDKFIFSPSLTFFIPLSISVSLTLYGFFRARNLGLKRIVIKTNKLPEGIKSLKIAQLADVHLGIIVREGLLDKAIRMIEEEKPDLILSTGDLIDGGIEHIEHLKDKLMGLNAPLGKFAIIGNHEFYTGIKRSQKFLEESGFVVLRSEGREVNGIINIIGIDDAETRSSKKDDNEYKKSEREILSELPQDRFTLLLKHKPEVDEESLGFFDLQLSGHTHNGQIFPINIIVRFFFYPHSSYKELSKGSAIYVSGGVGTAGPPVRLFSPPEIPIIEIQREG